jgi:hypothetical protein
MSNMLEMDVHSGDLAMQCKKEKLTEESVYKFEYPTLEKVFGKTSMM